MDDVQLKTSDRAQPDSAQLRPEGEQPNEGLHAVAEAVQADAATGDTLQAGALQTDALQTDAARAERALASAGGTVVPQLMAAAGPQISAAGESEQEALEKLLKEFESYEKRRAALAGEYARKIALLRSAAEEEAAGEAEKQRDRALAALDESLLAGNDHWAQLLGDISKKSVTQLYALAAEAKTLLDYLEGQAGAAAPTGFSERELRTLKESPGAVAKLQQTVKKFDTEINAKSPFKRFADQIGEAFERMEAGGRENIGAGIMQIGEAVIAVLPEVKQFGQDMGMILGDSQIGEDVDIAAQALAGVGKAAMGVGQMMSGDIMGGISSAASGVASIVSLANAAAERHREALKAVMNEKIAQQREYNLLLLEQNLLYEKGTTIFGNDTYGKAKNSVEVYKTSLADLNRLMAGTDAQKRAQRTKNFFAAFFGVKDLNAAKKEIYAGLADLEIVTGHKKTGLFGWGKGKDVYSSVLSVYPELVSDAGELNRSLAESILSTRKMKPEDKKTLEYAVQLAEQSEKAIEQVRDHLTGIFGELGNSLSDALVDAFKTGSDAGEAFCGSVSAMLEKLGKQMIYSELFAPLMEGAQKQMLEIMKRGDELSEEERFARLAAVLGQLTQDALTKQEEARKLMELMGDMAAEEGLDVFRPEAGREAAPKGIASASQQSVDELNGRFTAVQGHTFDIREAVNLLAAVRGQDLTGVVINTERLHTIDANIFGIREASNMLTANSARMLQHLAGIEGNTSRLHAMADSLADIRSELRTELSSVRQTVGNIALKGITLKR